jgi:hypothetical protein
LKLVRLIRQEPRLPEVAPPRGLDASDYETIEAAVMETARGRWFLLEHARRTRAAESDRMIAAIGRLAEIVGQQRYSVDQIDMQRRGLEMAAAIEERLLDLAWSLRAQGAEPAWCEEIEREAARLRLGVSETLGLEAETAPTLIEASTRREFPPETLPPLDEPVEAVAPPIRPEALAALDRLSTREKLRFFA